MIRRIRNFGASRSYCLVIGVFFLARASSTLVGGASFTLPGTGWRALFQLVAVAVVAAGLCRPAGARGSTLAVGTLYLFATASELINAHVLLGAIPVDMRDRLVHPAVAIAAYACVLVDQRMTSRPGSPLTA